jgi:hypothetical protein
MNEQEIWLDVNGYEGLYKISNSGRVWSVKRKMFRSLFVGKDGYLRVHFNVPGKRKHFLIHRLVAYHFIGNPSNETFEVNHIDGNKRNNHWENLEWCTRSENLKHAFLLGLKDAKGESHPRSKLSEKQVREIRIRKENGSMGIELAKEYGVSASVISAIVTRKNRKHI